MPPQNKRLLIDGSYSSEEFKTIKNGFVPQKPEDKWVIFFHQNNLLFFRSRTGTCVYQLIFKSEASKVLAHTVIVNREPSQYRSDDDEYDVAMVSYLIDTLLLGRFAPLPKPKGLREQDFSQYKRDVIGGDGRGSIGLKLSDN